MAAADLGMQIGLGLADNCRLQNNAFNEESCEVYLSSFFFSSCTMDMTFQTEVLTTFQTYSQSDVLIILLLLLFFVLFCFVLISGIRP